VNKLLPLALTLLASMTLAAQNAAPKLDPKVEKAVREALPVCGDATMTVEELPYKLPPRFTGTIVKTTSKRPSCDSQLVSVVSPTGSHFLGMPWFLEGEEGATLEDKLRNFTYRNMNMSVTAVIDRTPDLDGLWPVTLNDQTEAGKVPLLGRVDPAGKVFFFGTFRRGDVRADRAKTFEPFYASAPAKGPVSAKVTIVEFSDFECPSCKRAAGYLDPILAKHGDNIRYIRFDVPLSMHPWAFPASLAGRAIYRQKPELFWEYKKAVYNSQSELNAFVFWDWARAWAQDHDLNLERYDADLNNAALKEEILKGVGTAFSNDVRATPTYMVNGAVVDAGEEGKALAAYVDSLLR
jgi:thiol-disulfide isomerase/thioredoxin